MITISDSLRFFLKFTNLALLDFDGRVPERICLNSLRIAIRVMFKTETMDFFMDPRGVIPEDIAVAIHLPIPYQLWFIAGHEFDADIKSLIFPKLSTEEYKKLYESSLLWFGSLQIYEAACDVMYPSSSWSYKTHPTARDRYDNILDNAKTPDGVNIDNWKSFLNVIERYKTIIIEDISLNYDLYEMYGSTYLDEPDSEWRGVKAYW